MRISLYVPRSGLNPAVGFGYAAQNIVNSLHKLGHEVRWSDPKAQVQLNFTQPQHFKLHKNRRCNCQSHVDGQNQCCETDLLLPAPRK